MRRTYGRILLTAIPLILCNSRVLATIQFLDFNDGGIHNIDGPVDEDFVRVDYESPGLQTTVNVLEGANIINLEAWEDSIVNIFDGTVQDILASLGNTQTHIHGGSVFALIAMDNSQAKVFGCGAIEVLYLEQTAVMTIYGSDFAVDGTPVGYTELTGGIPYVYGQLTGTLQNGGSLNSYFEIRDSGRIVLVPEPATLLLLGLGGLYLRRRR